MSDYRQETEILQWQHGHPETALDTLRVHNNVFLRRHDTNVNGLLSRTPRLSRYQKGKTNLDFTEARDSEWKWHQLSSMQVCTLLQTDNHASTPGQVFYRPDAQPPPNQQRQSTEGNVFLMCWNCLLNPNQPTICLLGQFVCVCATALYLKVVTARTDSN